MTTMAINWKELALELLSISQAGLTYTENLYDIERYERLKAISAQILEEHTTFEKETIEKELSLLRGYLTPKVDVRAVILKENQILLVQERDNRRWALPGGWADVGLTPSENVVKEVREEAGLEVKANRLLAIWDKKCHNHPSDLNYTYKIFIECIILSGSVNTGLETTDARFFNPDDLPPLSTNRNTQEQIERAIALCRKGEAAFD